MNALKARRGAANDGYATPRLGIYFNSVSCTTLTTTRPTATRR